MKINLPYQRNSRTRSTIHADTDNPDEFTIVTRENLDPIIDHCKVRREGLMTHKDGLVPVAEIPLSIAERMMADGSFNDDAAMKRWLNDPDNRCFRIWEGRV